MQGKAEEKGSSFLKALVLPCVKEVLRRLKTGYGRIRLVLSLFSLWFCDLVCVISASGAIAGPQQEGNKLSFPKREVSHSIHQYWGTATAVFTRTADSSTGLGAVTQFIAVLQAASVNRREGSWDCVSLHPVKLCCVQPSTRTLPIQNSCGTSLAGESHLSEGLMPYFWCAEYLLLCWEHTSWTLKPFPVPWYS